MHPLNIPIEVFNFVEFCKIMLEGFMVDLDVLKKSQSEL